MRLRKPHSTRLGGDFTDLKKAHPHRPKNLHVMIKPTLLTL